MSADPQSPRFPMGFGNHDSLPHLRHRRFNLTPVPLQFSTLAHFDAEFERISRRGEEVEGLRKKTVAWMRDAYRSFRSYLRESPVQEREFLNGNAHRQVQLMEDWIAWLRTRGVSRSTIATYWRGLDALFRRLEEARGMFNPLSVLRPPKAAPPLPRALTRSSAEKLLYRIRNHPWRSRFEQHRNLALVGLMLLAGLRKGEVLRLTFDDVNLEAGLIRIERGKGRNGGKDRTAYPTPQLLLMLREYADERRRAGKTHPEFLSSLRGNRGIGEVTIRRVFRLLARELDLRLSPHMLRHTYATLLRQSGVPDRVAQELLGHSSLTMLQRYSHIFDGECSGEAAKLHLGV